MSEVPLYKGAQAEADTGGVGNKKLQRHKKVSLFLSLSLSLSLFLSLSLSCSLSHSQKKQKERKRERRTWSSGRVSTQRDTQGFRVVFGTRVGQDIRGTYPFLRYCSSENSMDYPLCDPRVPFVNEAYGMHTKVSPLQENAPP